MKMKIEIEIETENVEQARAADGVYYDSDCGKGWTSEMFLLSPSR